MGQKSNPISLRLKKTNQQWNSCWYGDVDYTAQFLENCRIDAYVQNICQQKKEAFPVICTKRGREQISVALVLPQKKRPNTNTFRPLQGSRSATNFQDWPLQVLGERMNERALAPSKGWFAGNPKYFPHSSDAQGISKVSDLHAKYARGFVAKFLASIFLEIPLSNFFSTIVQTVPAFSIIREGVVGKDCTNVFRRKNTAGAYAYVIKNHLERCMGVSLGARCKLYFLKCGSPHQNSLFLASLVVSSLQERIPFRRIKHRLIKDISKNFSVRGVRITCSGRVASRSKKAQKKKIESIQWGTTSLNVFSERVHFASKHAYTPFGKVGVKVWICYKNSP